MAPLFQCLPAKSRSKSSEEKNLSRGVISVEGWTNHQAAQDAFDSQMTSTLTPDLLARRETLRQRVLSRWSEQDKEEFRLIWRKWDGYDFLAKTQTPILELYGDRARDRPSLPKLHIPDRANITLRWIANASHSLLIENPAEVADACSAFVIGLTKSRKRR